MSRIVTMLCPHCELIAYVRSSQPMTALYRQLVFRCSNDLCGHVFVADLVAVRTVSPSACPNPEITLPFAKTVKLRNLSLQLELAFRDAANDPA